MVYKIRVILDAKEDIFRDIAVEENIQPRGFTQYNLSIFWICWP